MKHTKDKKDTHRNPSPKTHDLLKVPGNYTHTPSMQKLMSDVENKPKYGKRIYR